MYDVYKHIFVLWPNCVQRVPQIWNNIDLAKFGYLLYYWQQYSATIVCLVMDLRSAGLQGIHLELLYNLTTAT